mmetsp:Transcript_22799/g.77565  ORF Transcript_22799/g.77565 Transcript_22799/m.77565 type:complete len:364 (+) Transcript_22799:287-1378(+)
MIRAARLASGPKKSARPEELSTFLKHSVPCAHPIATDTPERSTLARSCVSAMKESAAAREGKARVNLPPDTSLQQYPSYGGSCDQHSALHAAAASSERDRTRGSVRGFPPGASGASHTSSSSSTQRQKTMAISPRSGSGASRYPGLCCVAEARGGNCRWDRERGASSMTSCGSTSSTIGAGPPGCLSAKGASAVAKVWVPRSRMLRTAPRILCACSTSHAPWDTTVWPPCAEAQSARASPTGPPVTPRSLPAGCVSSSAPVGRPPLRNRRFAVATRFNPLGPRPPSPGAASSRSSARFTVKATFAALAEHSRHVSPSRSTWMAAAMRGPWKMGTPVAPSTVRPIRSPLASHGACSAATCSTQA